jgi:hypothetical protein
MVACCCTVFSLLMAGCGSSTPQDMPNLAPVTGTVTQKGVPLAEAVVIFEPEAGGAASSGITDAMGRFELQYNATEKGAVPGTHRVRISKMEGEAGDELIPSKFNTNSTMTQVVSDSQPNDFKIEI